MRFGVLALLASCSLLAGCNPERRACEDARKTATIDGWREYLARHPSGLCVTEADAEIPRLVREQREKLGREMRRSIPWVRSPPAGVWFTRSEVTVKQFKAYEEARARSAGVRSGQPAARSVTKADACNLGQPDRDDHPMNCIAGPAAIEYCTWIGGRLPTREEWLAEATAGGVRRYPWGDAKPTSAVARLQDVPNPNCAMYGECLGRTTVPVCSIPAGNSASGLCDMVGNVEEITKAKNSTGGWLSLGGGFRDHATFEGERCENCGARRAAATAFFSQALAAAGDSTGFRCVSETDPAN